MVEEGDILCEIDGKPVLRLPPSEVSPYLLGPKDTIVVITFLRGEEPVTVNLKRQTPAYYAKPTVSRSECSVRQS
jgi:C-terminal processing protease CtpA/Prc